MKKQFIVSVGIMHAETIEFELNSAYTAEGCEKFYSGAMNVQLRNGKIFWEGKEFEELLLVPKTPNYRFDFVNRQVVKENKYLSCDEGTFWLKDVTIGVNFHWERKEKEKFSGALKFLIEDGMIAAINIIGIEDYLTSVISSEMSADASLELLKAHAVISRSWLIAQIEKSREIVKSERKYQACTRTESELIKWSDREDHTLFDVCADDHCQRYQGLTRESTKTVIRAVDSTWGEVLKYDGKICDARFSKSCGGVFEEFPTCWEPVDYPYLKKKRDSKTVSDFPDLTVESEAEKWIMSSPESFCNTRDKEILNQVLNNYDQETTDFYRWKVSYTQEELSALIRKKSGEDYGDIIDLVPVARGTSGRLYKLRIVGTKKTFTVGKELEIRRLLSESHLYSSAFVVKTDGVIKSSDGKTDVPAGFTLYGAGWGHGVGLCQIGAAVMGAKGYDYREILLHYFSGASIEKEY